MWFFLKLRGKVPLPKGDCYLYGCMFLMSPRAGFFLFGQYITGQVSQFSAESISKPKGTISPHSHCHPSEPGAFNSLSQKGHLGIFYPLNLFIAFSAPSVTITETASTAFSTASLITGSSSFLNLDRT